MSWTSGVLRRLLSALSLTCLVAVTVEAHAFCRQNACRDNPETGHICERDEAGCIIEGVTLYYSSPCLSFGVARGAGQALEFSDDEFEAIVMEAFGAWKTADCGEGRGPGFEVRSVGDFPTGIRAEILSGDHPSILRNPLIAGAFHRTGAVEVWGRGTNRVIEACRAYGVARPEFSKQAGVVTVTFEAAVVPDAVAGPSRDQVGTKSGLSGEQVQILELASVPRSLQELMEPSGRTNRTKFRDQVVAPLLEAGLLEMTIPDKPRSSRQQYRTTPAGARLLEEGNRE